MTALIADKRVPGWAHDFFDRSNEWRRLAAELIGTFFLVLVAAGAGVVNAVTGGSVGRSAVGGRAGPDGDGDHPGHRRGVRRPPEPGRERCLRAPARVPVEAGPRLPGRPGRRRAPRLPVPPGHLRHRRRARRDDPGAAHDRSARHVHRGGAHLRPAHHHPRDCVGRPERRDLLCPGRGRLHRAGRPVGEPGQRRFDEPGALVRPRRRLRPLRAPMGVPGRSGHRDRSWPSPSRTSCGAPAATRWRPGPPRARSGRW